MIDVPCLNCQDRKLGCHSKCKEYKNFRKLKDKENDRRKREAYKHGRNYL